MSAAAAGLLGLVVGATVAGGAVAALLGQSGRRADADSPAQFAVAGEDGDDRSSRTLPEGYGGILSVLPGAAFVVGDDGSVLRSSAATHTLGLVRGDRVAVPEIAALVTLVRRDGVIRENEMEVRRPPLGMGVLQVRVRVAPLTDIATLVMVEDLSEAHRIDAVRRDFVANVSHELKTPVGALSLLAEAVQAASDEPDAVRRFSARMQLEAQRLSNLVNDLIDLSRLQGAQSPRAFDVVEMDRIVHEALDATKLAAHAREIELVSGPNAHAYVLGDEGQLGMAMRNLVTNAIAYSPPNTRVAIAVRLVPGAESSDSVVEVSVTDQGIGIPESEQARIFERFYRVDPARSRITGGTGLGLAIVKHVSVNHGGECTVWSVEGEGSTFTLRLPSCRPAKGETKS